MECVLCAVCCANISPPPSPSPASIQCEAGYGTAFSADKKKATSSYGITGIANIQRELMNKGRFVLVRYGQGL